MKIELESQEQLEKIKAPYRPVKALVDIENGQNIVASTTELMALAVV